MKKVKILLADNDQEFLKLRKDFLENEGFEVLTANNPEESIFALNNEDIDLAIIDLRLEDDKDKYDISGLMVAKAASPKTPKIIQTCYPSIESVRKALGAQINGLPIAFDFLEKKRGLEEMLRAIKRVLKINENFINIEKNTQRIDKITIAYKLACEQAKKNYQISNFISIIGIVIIFSSVIANFFNLISNGNVGIISGTVIEAVGIMFFKRVDKANTRMDKFYDDHKRITNEERIGYLLERCNELSLQERRDECREKIINYFLKS